MNPGTSVLTPGASLIVISDVNGSPMLTEIVAKLFSENMQLQIILIVGAGASISEEIKRLGIPIELWPRKSISSWPTYIVRILLTIRRRKIMQVYCSGQLATLVGITSGFLSRLPSRIYTRHHSNVHHSKTDFYWRNGRAKIFDLLMNHLSTKIIAVSDSIRNVLIIEEQVSPNKVLTIHNGILLQEFLNVGSRRKQKEITTEKCNFPIIGVISRITEGKGVEYTASAFCQILEEYPMARLIVVGEPSDSYSRVAKILSAIDQSAYEFRTREENITDFFAEIDIFVHVPVSADYEAFGLVYIEAIASQVPSIFTISGILKELEHPDRYFHTVPYRDSVAIASAIESLVESIDDTARIVPDAWLNQFSLENTAAEYFEVLKLDKG